MADTKTPTRKTRGKRQARTAGTNAKAHGNRSEMPVKAEPSVTEVTEVPQDEVDPLSGMSKAALDALQTNVFLCDRNLDLVYMNEKARTTLNALAPEIESCFGIKVEEMLHGSIHRFHRDPKAVERFLNNPATLPHKATFNFGEVRLETCISAIYDENGAYIGNVVNWEDVGERLENEARLNEAAENAGAIMQVLLKIGSMSSVDETTKAALDSILQAFSWDYGSFWEMDSEARVLRFKHDSGNVSDAFMQATRSTTFVEGVGLCGRAWRQRDLYSVEDLATLADCPRATIARKAGIKSAICFPVIIEGKVIGAMDFFSTGEMSLSAQRLEAFRVLSGLVSTNLGRVSALGKSAKVERALYDAKTPIIMIDRDFIVTYLNGEAKKLLTRREADFRQLFGRFEVDSLIGSCVDKFHSNPQHQRNLLSDPLNLPHKTNITIGDAAFALTVTAITDLGGDYVGNTLALEDITEKMKVQNATDKASVSLKESSIELVAVANQMAGNAEETSVQTSSVSSASEEVSRNISSVATAIEEMDMTIKEIASRAVEAARVAENAVAVAADANQVISSLGGSSQEISKVIKVITSIAEQTNLLALNATIEAARAGEAGKGFAVVANEVKELAKETAKATEEITEKIEKIQVDSSSSMKSIKSVSQTINKVNEIANTIASAVEEQAATSNDIARNVAEAAIGADSIVESITQVSRAAENTASGAAASKAQAEGLTELANEMRELVKQMKA